MTFKFARTKIACNIQLLYSEPSALNVKATIKTFTSLNLSPGQGIVYILRRFAHKAPASTASFSSGLFTDRESAQSLIQGKKKRPGNHVDRTATEGDKGGECR